MPRYKAFISYSHEEEYWARWLQHSLERYRVPKRLVGEQGEFGRIPSRLRPIFRDREDLSSSPDLSARIKDELAQSDTLIVICSPAAAASRWVNEEVRYFIQLGRGKRVLCLIVDGDPQVLDTSDSCFPVAVLESPDGSRREPLAADVRRFADGKRLALLKIIAGILGVRLDKLRQRDTQRRYRRIWVSTSAAVLVAMGIGWLTYSQLTTRAAAEAQRANTEVLLRFMLGDLDRLDPIQGVERISPEDTEQARFKAELGLEHMDNDSLIEEAMSWRDMGMDLNWEGRIDDADIQFGRSRAALIELYQREGNTPRAMFELAQSEYYVGEIHITKGEIDEALQHWTQYGALARRLVNTEPNNPRYVMELSYSLMNLGALEQQRPTPETSRTLALLQAAVQYNQMALVLDPDNSEYRDSLMNQLAWLANAYSGICALGNALEARQQVVDLGLESQQNASLDNRQLEALALYVTGLAQLQRDIGLNGQAAANFMEAGKILQQLHIVEPENQDIEWEMLRNEALVGRLQMATGATSEAEVTIETLAPRIQQFTERESESNHFRAVQSALFATDHAVILLQLGQTERGESMLSEATDRMADLVRLKPGMRASLKGLVVASFRYWQHFNSIPDVEWALLQNNFLSNEINLESCTNANLAARLAIMFGDQAKAQALTQYALSRGYFEADFVKFCRKYETCDLQ